MGSHYYRDKSCQCLCCVFIKTINGKDTYAIKDGKTTLYYDVTSGLKLADSKQWIKERSLLLK
jgi:hypothetical protein